MSMFAIGAAEVLVVAAMLLGSGVGGVPLGGVPLPPDAGLQSVAPADCLAYAAHFGLTDADAKSPNHYEKLLAEPENRAFFAEVNRVAEALLKTVPEADEPAKLLKETLPTIIRAAASRPSVFYIADVDVPPKAPSVNTALVLHAGDQLAALRDAAQKWERFYLTQLPPKQTVETSTVEGVEVRRLPMPPGAPPVVWGVTGEYLFVAAGEGEAARLIARLRDRPAATDWLRGLTQDAKIPRLGGMLYVNTARIFQIAEPFLKQAALLGAPFDLDKLIDASGIRQLRYVALASGLDDSTAVTKLLVGHEADAKGILALLNGQPITKADLAGIPRSADFALAARVDGSQIFKRIIAAVAEVEPRAIEEFNRELGQAEEEIGFGIQRDLLDGLGDLWTIYNSPTEGGALLTGVCTTVSVRDRAKIERVIEQLLRVLEAEVGRGSKPPFAIRKTTVGERTINYLQFLQEPIPIAPSWCFTDDRLVFALSPQMVRVHLSRAADAGSLADLDSVAKQLATGDVVALSYAETGFGIQILYSYLQYAVMAGASALEKETGIQADLSTFPSFTAIAPHMHASLGVVRSSATVWSAESYATGPSIGPIAMVVAGFSVGVAMPSVTLARASAQQYAASNQLRQFAIAATLYTAQHNKPLPRAILSADGKPLLSWRVMLLPYLDRQDLYDRFKLDEPWDSAHNRSLIAAMPSLYRHPNMPELTELGATAFQIPLGEGTLYGDETAPKKLKDGTPAVLFVESNSDQAVVWTKPEDLTMDADSPLFSLYRHNGSEVQAALTDGSVRRVRAFSDGAEEREFLKFLFPNK